ncbi:MAG: helix-turn-helix domain-containing protein [Propionibacteriaceae bacterium]|jgi:transcriptional regulator with XRE-family HTH domain|nr:helix-turn-helix domain-containing protein [Propionibacteriaceae bacterium]
MDDDRQVIAETIDWVFPFNPTLPVASPSEALRAMRRHAGLTQTQLAAMTRTSQSSVAAAESGERIPTLPTIARIAEATNHILQVRICPLDGTTVHHGY